MFWYLHIPGFLLLLALAFSSVRHFRKESSSQWDSLGHSALAILLLFGFFQSGQPFPHSPSQALLFCIFLILCSQVLSQAIAKTERLAPFTLIPLSLAYTIALFLQDKPWKSQVFESTYMSRHLIGSLSAYTCFGIASILGIMYILLFKRLKQKKFDLIFQRLPSLDKLDELMRFWIYIGCFCALLSILFVSLWYKETQQSIRILEWAIGLGPLLSFSILLALHKFGRCKGFAFVKSFFVCFGVILLLHAFNIH